MDELTKGRDAKTKAFFFVFFLFLFHHGSQRTAGWVPLSSLWVQGGPLDQKQRVIKGMGE
jgi:hypothetical protein